MKSIAELVSTNAQSGTLEWIGIRPERRGHMHVLDQVNAQCSGLEGDHYQSGGKRTVSLVQKEHLSVIASFLDHDDDINPCLLRRNLVISGINLLGLRNKKFRIGEAIFEGTGLCAPCSRMEENLGPGGYAAVRGHGGIVAMISKPAIIGIGDTVSGA